MGISFWELLLVLVAVLVIFGPKRLRSVGSDLGAAIRGFRDAMHEEPTSAASNAAPRPPPSSQPAQAHEPAQLNGRHDP